MSFPVLSDTSSGARHRPQLAAARCCATTRHRRLALVLVASIYVLSTTVRRAGALRPTAIPRIRADSLQDKEKAAFLERYGSSYGYSGRIDALHQQEIAPRFSSEEEPHQHYMDHTAAQLYLNSQLQSITKELESGVFGNPHSASPSSRRTAQAMEAVAQQLLEHFSARPDEHELVFTRSATGALRMIGEAFPWSSQSALLLLRSNHNSMLGIREHACAAGARLGTTEQEQMEEWLTDIERAVAEGREQHAARLGVHGPYTHDWATGEGLTHMSTCRGHVPQFVQGGGDEVQSHAGASGLYLNQQSSTYNRRLHEQTDTDTASRGLAGGTGAEAGGAGHSGREEVVYNLAAYLASDNFDGSLYPLDWCERLHRVPSAPAAPGAPRHRWLVALDAAAFAPHHRLNITAVQPDFAVFSFYKLFGIPSGIGALIVRKDVARHLWPRYFAGGSIFTATAALRWHMLHQPPQRLEPGTPAFLEIIALQAGLKTLNDLGGIEAVQSHTQSVAQYLAGRLLELRHPGAGPVVRVFGRWQASRNSAEVVRVQGPTVNFLVLDRDGQVVSYKAVGLAAARAGIHLRWGCMCNPGSCYRAVVGAGGHGTHVKCALADPALATGQRGVRDSEVRAYARQAAAADPTGGEEWEDKWEFLAVNRTDPATGAERSVTLPLGSLRASLGWMSRWEDAWALLQFVSGYTNTTAAEVAARHAQLLRESPELGRMGWLCGSG